MFILRPPGLVYDGETPEEAAEIDREIAANNAAWQRNLDAWRPGKPAKFYEKWCRKHAPHLLDPIKGDKRYPLVPDHRGQKDVASDTEGHSTQSP